MLVRYANGPKSFRAWVMSILEPVLQHEGFEITFLLLYIISNILVGFRGAAIGWELGADHPFPIFDLLARTGGALINFNSALIFLVSSKSLLTFLRNSPLNMIVPFDKAMPNFHAIIGYVMAGATVLHVVFQVCNYIVLGLLQNNLEQRWGFARYDKLLATGVVLIFAIVLLVLGSIPMIRRYKREWFWISHHIGFIYFVLFLVLHGYHNGTDMTWRYILGPIIIYGLDKCYMLYRMIDYRKKIPNCTIERHGNDIVCIRIPRAFNYIAGQYAEIMLPYISRFEWHPFTIASSPHESEIVFYIKKNGNWTEKLHEIASEADLRERLTLLIRGPFGAPAQHVGQFDHVVLISGGVGATPFAAITKYVHYWIRNYGGINFLPSRTSIHYSDFEQNRRLTQQNASSRKRSMFAAFNSLDAGFVNAPYSERILFYLNTVTLNWALLWIMILRFCSVAVGGIVGRHLLPRREALHLFNSELLAYFDIFLASTLLLPIILSIGFKLRSSGLKHFLMEDLGNVIDLTVLLPLKLSTFVPLIYFLSTGKQLQTALVLTVAKLWPTIMVILFWRSGRNAGSRVFLAKHQKNSHANTQSLDFIWASKEHAEDQWLIKEMLPLTGNNSVRLHRFITREDPVWEPWMEDYRTLPFITKYERPDYDAIFSQLVERTRSGTVVGVFFCGPKGMARSVRQSALRAMALSVRNGLEYGHINTNNDAPWLHRTQRSPTSVTQSEFGCNIRFVVRIENFE